MQVSDDIWASIKENTKSRINDPMLVPLLFHGFYVIGIE
jgi:hypothetical protein